MRQVISRFSPFGMTNHYTFVLDKIDAIKATVTTAAAATVSTTLPLALSSTLREPWKKPKSRIWAKIGNLIV